MRGDHCLDQSLRNLLNASSYAKGSEKILELLKDAGYDEISLGRSALSSLTLPSTVSITNPTNVEERTRLDQVLFLVTNTVLCCFFSQNNWFYLHL